jgi:hypothetical protein
MVKVVASQRIQHFNYFNHVLELFCASDPIYLKNLNLKQDHL